MKNIPGVQPNKIYQEQAAFPKVQILTFTTSLIT